MKRISWVIALLFLFLALAGCAVPNQARLIRSGEVNRLVESATILPDHIYYYTGPEARPDAIIAIGDHYTLASKYWIRVDITEEILEDWNLIIDNASRYRDYYEGYWILTPEGERAGFWYSQYEYSVIRFPDLSTIIVYTPFVPTEDDLLPSIDSIGFGF